MRRQRIQSCMLIQELIALKWFLRTRAKISRWWHQSYMKETSLSMKQPQCRNLEMSPFLIICHHLQLMNKLKVNPPHNEKMSFPLIKWWVRRLNQLQLLIDLLNHVLWTNNLIFLKRKKRKPKLYLEKFLLQIRSLWSALTWNHHNSIQINSN